MLLKTCLYCVCVFLIEMTVSQYTETGYQYCNPYYQPIYPLKSSSSEDCLPSFPSPIPPAELYIVSKNSIGGTLEVSGHIPFLAVVSMEGTMPASGQSSVCYDCGNCICMIAEKSFPRFGYGIYFR